MALETEKIVVEQVAFATIDQLMTVFGPYDANVSLIERALDVKINARDKQVSGGESHVNAAVSAANPTAHGPARGRHQRWASARPWKPPPTATANRFWKPHAMSSP
ncbi:MAG: hypothetical protein ACLUO4_09685 [Christensenellales bacterium]